MLLVWKKNDAVIKQLQEDNKHLPENCTILKKKINVLESSINEIEQCDQRNNLVVPDIADSVTDDRLE